MNTKWVLSIIVACMAFVCYKEWTSIKSIQNHRICMEYGYQCQTVKQCKLCADFVEFSKQGCTTDQDCEDRYGY